MTSKLKCPFCNSELVGTIGHPYCRNEKCEMCDEMLPRELLDLLDRTRKALEIARKALKEYANKDNWGCVEDDRDRVWHTYWYFDGCDDGGWVKAQKALNR